MLPGARASAIRPLEGLALRGAYSQTVARPSFREMGFYVSVEPGTDDLIVGNPQLGLSDVESYDTRAEYTWGELGDLVAVSVFYKTIQDPIESIVVRNPLNFEGSSSALYRTFFNNPNKASLWGIELEARKNFGFLGPDFAQYLSIGGNFTYINAKVDRTEIELARSRAFFGTAAADEARFSDLSQSRRLFGQPEWIANADLSFDEPDWGTKATLAFFAISDVLDAAGSATISPNGSVISFTLDRYVDSFSQLDLILSQTWHVELLRGDLTFKFSVEEPHRQHAQDRLRPLSDEQEDSRALLQGRSRLQVQRHLLVLTPPASLLRPFREDCVKPATRAELRPRSRQRGKPADAIRGRVAKPPRKLRDSMSGNRRRMAADRENAQATGRSLPSADRSLASKRWTSRKPKTQ